MSKEKVSLIIIAISERQLSKEKHPKLCEDVRLIFRTASFRARTIKMRVLAGFVLIFVLTKDATSEPDLQQQNQDNNLNPVSDNEQTHPVKDQDKRTIFSSPHHGWAKHVGVHPSGFKYIIGYGPVDLKYVPVVKPVSIHAHPHYHHHHHRLKFHLKRPLVIKPLLPVHPVVHTDGWKPVVPLVKPVVPIVKPVPVHVPAPPHIPHNPWQQEGWTNFKPVHVHPVTVVKPVKPALVPVKPVHPVVPVRPVVQFKPTVQVPAAPPLVPVRPILPAPVFPLFPQVPTAPGGVPLHNPGIVAQYAPGAFLHHHHHIVPPAAPPVLFPQPAPSPVLVQQPQPVYPIHLHPTHVHPQPPPPHVQVPHEQHDVQIPLIPQNHPIFQQQPPHHVHQIFQQQPAIFRQQPEVFHQHLPQEPQPAFHPQPEVFHQQLPHNPDVAFHQPEVFQQQLPHNPDVAFQQPEVFQQQLPHNPDVDFHQQVPVEQPENPPYVFNQQLPGNVQHLFNQQIQHGDSATSSVLLQGSIQPGHSDLQLPLHLPQHPNYLPPNAGQFEAGSVQPEHLVRPSVSLEPPYSRKK